jgi:hypothetical protein
MLGGQACSRRLAVWPDVDDRTKADLESKRQRLARHRLELAPLTRGVTPARTRQELVHGQRYSTTKGNGASLDVP